MNGHDLNSASLLQYKCASHNRALVASGNPLLISLFILNVITFRKFIVQCFLTFLLSFLCVFVVDRQPNKRKSDGIDFSSIRKRRKKKKATRNLISFHFYMPLLNGVVHKGKHNAGRLLCTGRAVIKSIIRKQLSPIVAC